MMPLNGHNLSDWLTKTDTAARLGISERTLDRLVMEGKAPERRLRPRDGRKPEPVFNPSDVDALIAAANKPMILPAISPIGANVGVAAARGDDDIPAGLKAVLDLIGQLAAIAHRPAIAAPQEAHVAPAAPTRLFLTIPEARAYTGLSERFLRRLIREGQLPAVRDGATKVRKADLDNFASVSQLAGLGSGLGPAVCSECGCTEERACMDRQTMEVCSWAEPGLCSFCAEGRQDVDRAGGEERQLVRQMGGAS